MKNGTRVKRTDTGETGVIVRAIGMCYDVKMDRTGEVLSGGKPRWKRVSVTRPKALEESR